MNRTFRELTNAISNCQICASHFEHDPRPVFQLSQKASILVAGQAPGRKVHKSGIPFDDPSGDRLRDWMGVSTETFYDADKIAILPMGFCYPGHGRSGDLPPRQECAEAWRQQILDVMPNIQLTLVIGRYAMEWHLGSLKNCKLTDVVRAWKSYAPTIIPLPHPSPRNNIWLRKNAWFEKDVLPALQRRVRKSLS
ncbi:uracil-DNA glycosylase family protein [Sulfuriflexus mobilis]|uniref:uracil-DNA glycosylase family protein n=1 Tax=Sulfuriflexus mobilis TaxID=1811807 RepID=UPI000F81C76A|nr:uracil-DNA glycosylase family protein [Sulfuriflexus mobilis]